MRAALNSPGTAAAALLLAIATALNAATGYLEAERRAPNVVFEAPRGRSFTRRKLIDVASTFVPMAVALTTLLLMFASKGALVTRSDSRPTARRVSETSIPPLRFGPGRRSVSVR